MSRLSALCIVLTSLLAACAHRAGEPAVAPQAALAAPQGVSLAGYWLYNPGASDQPGSGTQASGAPPGGSGGRGGMPGGMPRGMPGGMPGGEPGGEPSGRGGPPTEGMGAMDTTVLQPARRLVVTQTDSTMTIDQRNPRDSVSYTLYFDGRAVAAPGPLGGSRAHITGHWVKKRFVVARELPNGATLTEGYELSRHGQRLAVYVKISGPPGESGPQMSEMRRVYDRIGG